MSLENVNNTMEGKSPLLVSKQLPKILQQDQLGLIQRYRVDEFRGPERNALRQPLDEDFYQRIQPTLEIASTMLSVCLPLFAKILFAPRQLQRPTDRKTNVPVVVFDPAWRCTSTELVKAKAFIDDLHERCDVTFIEGDRATGDEWHGICCYIYEPAPKKCYIGLDPRYYQVCSHPDYTRLRPDRRSALEYYLADTIVHEIGHACNFLRQSQCLPEGHPKGVCGECSPREASYSHADRLKPELGFATSDFLFDTHLTMGAIWKEGVENYRGDYDEMTQAFLELEETIASRVGIARWRYSCCTPSLACSEADMVPESIIHALSKRETWHRLTADLSPEYMAQAVEQGGSLHLLDRVEQLLKEDQALPST